MKSCNRWKQLIWMGGLLLAPQWAAAQPLPPPSTTAEYRPGVVVVKFKSGVSVGSMQVKSLFADIGVQSYEKVFSAARPLTKSRNQKIVTPSIDLSNIYLLTLANQNIDVAMLSQYISRFPYVEYAEPDYLAELTATPNDPFWGLVSSWDPSVNYLWGLEKIQADLAWNLTTGDPSVIIAILDSGVDYHHPDLADNIWFNPGEDHPPLGSFGPEDIDGIDNDGNTVRDDVIGYNFYGKSGSAVDDLDGHGTWVAGIAGAKGNNGQGMTGVSWNSKIMLLSHYSPSCNPAPIDCKRECRSIYSTSAADAIDYARIMGADVINMSVIWTGTDLTLKDAIINAHASGVTIVAATGNDNRDMDLFNVTPARWPWVISAGGTDQFDHRWKGYYGANWGASLDVVAPAGGPHGPQPPPIDDPGKNVLGTLAEQSWMELCSINPVVPEPGCVEPQPCASQYLRNWGTSASAPYVTGLVALLKSLHPEFTHEQIRQVIRLSAEDLLDPEGSGENLPGFDIYSGYGRINAFRAICDDPANVLCDSNPMQEMVANPQEALIISPMSGDIVSGTVNIYGIAKGPQFSNYLLEYGSGVYPTTWVLLSSSSTPTPDPSPVNGSLLGSINGDQLSAGEYTFRLTVTSTLAHGYSDRVTIRVAPPIYGFPTKDLNDGKMVTVVGNNLSTISTPQITFFIGVDSSQSNFSVELYDADMALRNFADACPGNPAANKTFYSLYADPFKDGSGTLLVAQLVEDPWIPPDIDGILDQGLTLLYSGSVHPEAQAPSGNYFYRLEVVLGPDANTPDPSVPCINSFKALTTGQIGIISGNLQFMALDQNGPYQAVGGGNLTPPYWCAPVTRPSRNPYYSYGVDTGYDGKFSFYFFVPSTASSFDLVDADADSLCDGCVDQDASNPSKPGWAQGETYRIAYAILNPKGDLLQIRKTVAGTPKYWLYNFDVSGSYDPSRNDYDLETATAVCTGSCVSGYHLWYWFNVLAENNIHIRPPFSSIYELTPEPFPWLAVTSAKSLGFYKNLSNTKLSDFLPQVLGQLDENGYPLGITLLVSDVSLAREIMAKKGPRILSYAPPIRNLLTQLLIAKFNLLRAEEFGEPLESAVILGTELSVADVVGSADELITSLECSNCPLSKEIINKLNENTKLLDLLNQGMVLYGTSLSLGQSISSSPLPNKKAFSAPANTFSSPYPSNGPDL